MTLDGNAVRSVDRAAALLLALGESRGEAGVTELARRLGPAQVDRLAPARDPREAGARRAGRRVRQVPAGPGRDPARREGRAHARPALDRHAGAGPARAGDTRDHRPRGARRRPDPHRRPGRRPQPRGRGRLDRARRAAALGGGRQGPPRLHGRARDPASRPPGPGPVHGAHDHAAGAARSRSSPGSAAAATRRRSASTTPASTPSPRPSSTPAATSRPPWTSGAPPSGSPRAGSRSSSSRFASPPPPSPCASGARPPEPRHAAAGRGSASGTAGASGRALGWAR